MPSTINFKWASNATLVTEEDIAFILLFTGPVDGEEAQAKESQMILYVQTAPQQTSNILLKGI